MLLDRRDIDFILFDWLNGAAAADRELVSGVLDTAERIAERELLPHYKLSDVNEPYLDASGEVRIAPEIADGIRAIADAGLFSTVFEEDLGGAALPFSVYCAALAILKSGNIAAAAYLMLTVANARLITTFGSAEQIKAFAVPQIAGEMLGTMCLSEPAAGSGLGDVVTKAVFAGEDELGHRYLLSGNKMWISAGDHDASSNIVHLVLARIPDLSGRVDRNTNALSLFIVPKLLPDGQRNDVTVAGLNHKMGYRGVPNCLLNFGEGRFLPDAEAGAVGWLVGAPGHGMRKMFQMMNEARIGVGIGGAALACRAYQLSLDYARQRRQGRRPGSEEPAQIIEHPDVARMLINQKVFAEGSMALALYAADLADRAGSNPASRRILDLLTPVVKTWPSIWGLQACDLAIQIHGGYGYTRDFDVEQLYRDGRLNPIHEGTTGIQAIDLVGRKIVRDLGRSFFELLELVRADLQLAEHEGNLREAAAALAQRWSALDAAVRQLIEREGDLLLNGATAFLLAFGHCVTGWLWLSQALAASARGGGAATATGKVIACRHFVSSEIPRVDRWLDAALGEPAEWRWMPEAGW